MGGFVGAVVGLPGEVFLEQKGRGVDRISVLKERDRRGQELL